MKVLIVEDDKLSRTLLQRWLQRRGYETIVAVNGQQAVEVARTALPDLILMDLNMPVMDGWTATRTIKEQDATKSIPVIALTAHALAGDRQKAIDAGCDEYDTKPLQIDRLQGKMKRLLGMRQGQGLDPTS